MNFRLKGFGYSPIPAKESAASSPFYGNLYVKISGKLDASPIYNRDIQKMRSAGVNTIRHYAGGTGDLAKIGDYLDQLWNGGKIMNGGLWVGGSESAQKEAFNNQWDDIYKFGYKKNKTIGGLSFEWSDEWWKPKNPNDPARSEDSQDPTIPKEFYGALIISKTGNGYGKNGQNIKPETLQHQWIG